MNAFGGEAVEISSGSLKLAGRLWVPPQNRPAPALVVGHGAGDRKEPYFEFCDYLCRRGIAALVLDLAGHGESEGPRYHVNIRQWVADYRAALDFLCARTDIDTQRLGAFGISSSGTAVLEAALEEP